MYSLGELNPARSEALWLNPGFGAEKGMKRRKALRDPYIILILYPYPHGRICIITNITRLLGSFKSFPYYYTPSENESFKVGLWKSRGLM